MARISYNGVQMAREPAQPAQTNRSESSRKPVQKATVIESACKPQTRPTSTADKTVLDRIQKCLDRAYHANTSETETKAALFVSQKLMSQHNVSQADFMASDGNSDKGHFGGQSVVRIEKTRNPSKRVVKEAFVHKLENAMCTFFDCKVFSTDYKRCVDWTFYGIASNTAAAAMAFEMAHNKILEWACAYKGGSPTFSYRLGVADGLVAMANREKQRELDQVRRKELDVMAAKDYEDSRERQQQLDRLRLQPAPSTSASSPAGSVHNDPNSMDVESDMAYPDADCEDESEDESESEGFGFRADFNTDDAQAMDLDDDLDKHIERFAKMKYVKSESPSESPKFSVKSEISAKPETGIKTEPKLESPNLSKVPEYSAKSEIKAKSEPGIKTEQGLESIPEASPWESGMQLVRFRQTAEQVADDYLTQNNIELLESTKWRPSNIRDRDAYRQGQKDSAKINVHSHRDGYSNEAFERA